jgi:hypothetical protein
MEPNFNTFRFSSPRAVSGRKLLGHNWGIHLKTPSEYT